MSTPPVLKKPEPFEITDALFAFRNGVTDGLMHLKFKNANFEQPEKYGSPTHQQHYLDGIKFANDIITLANDALITSFSSSAAWAVHQLWIAHGGSAADNRIDELGKILFDHFSDKQQTTPVTAPTWHTHDEAMNATIGSSTVMLSIMAADGSSLIMTRTNTIKQYAIHRISSAEAMPGDVVWFATCIWCGSETASSTGNLEDVIAAFDRCLKTK